MTRKEKPVFDENGRLVRIDCQYYRKNKVDFKGIFAVIGVIGFFLFASYCFVNCVLEYLGV